MNLEKQLRQKNDEIAELRSEIHLLKMKLKSYEGLMKNLAKLNQKAARELGEFYEFDPHA